MLDFENDLLFLLSDVARHMRTYGNQLAQQHGITFAQLTILARLEGASELSQNELAAITELAPITVARLLDRLEELGLVKRCADPKDRRIWRLRLTPVASSLVRDIKALRAKLFLVATKGINASVLGMMARGLQQMKENVSSQLLTECACESPISKLERNEHFADSIQPSETLPSDKPATAKHAGDQRRTIRRILNRPNAPQFPVKYRVREDPPPSGEPDMETAERDCRHTLRNIEPQSKKIVSR
jgi:MarR family transcriptional regulator for hemolysin